MVGLQKSLTLFVLKSTKALLSPEQGHDSDATECDCEQDDANRRPHRAADVFLVRVVVNILSGDSRSFLSHFHFGGMVGAERVSWLWD